MTVGRRLLYITPVMPSRTGNGLAMRAGMVLEALTHHYAVWLLVVPVNPIPSPDALPHDSLTQAAVTVGREVAVNRVFADIPFDVVHVFRLTAAPFAEPYRQAYPHAHHHLDVDERETVTNARIAALMHANGEGLAAGRHHVEVRRWQPWEAALHSWDRVYVASKQEFASLSDDQRRRARVLPNAVRDPGSRAARVARSDFTLLFVGTLGYYPNEDAVVYFAEKILPRIRARAKRPVRAVVAGPNARPRLVTVARECDLELVGFVPDLAEVYAAADAVVVPLRAGGGTRIKVLEAFAYGCPVVSTSLGVEGIECRDGEHVFIADDPATFAERCVALVNDDAVGRRLAASARELWSRSHTLDAVVRAVAP